MSASTNVTCLLALSLVAPFTQTLPAGEPQNRLKILDNEPRLFVLTGGGQLTGADTAGRFKEFMQRYYANKCPHSFEVVPGAAANPHSGKSWADLASPVLMKAKAKKVPIVVLAQLPPLVMKPTKEMVVRNDKDIERIKAYGNIFEEFGKSVRNQGADLVILSMEGAVGPNQSDPNSGTSFAHLWRVSDEIEKRSLPGIVVGPRVFQTFDKHRHLYKKKDHHITQNGKVLVTHLWLQALCRLDGVPIPEWSQKEMAAILAKP